MIRLCRPFPTSRERVVSCLKLYLIGSPRLELDGVDIRLSTHKSFALLAYLAVTRQSHRRETLVNLLWPNAGRTSGKAALRNTLHDLREAVGSGIIVTSREAVELKPDFEQASGLWMDVIVSGACWPIAGSTRTSWGKCAPPVGSL